MGKRSGFTRFILLLLVGMSGSAAAVARERAVTTAWENESIEALCFPTENGTPDAVCITLYADEDGYELCVADRTASTERCVSNYRFGDPDGSEDDGPEEDRWSVVNL